MTYLTLTNSFKLCCVRVHIYAKSRHQQGCPQNLAPCVLFPFMRKADNSMIMSGMLRKQDNDLVISVQLLETEKEDVIPIKQLVPMGLR